MFAEEKLWKNDSLIKNHLKITLSVNRLAAIILLKIQSHKTAFTYMPKC